jgi:cytochrome b561
MTATRRTLPTKLLHAALLLSVLWQLGASSLVERPRAGQLGNAFYEIHQTVGLATLGLVLAFWLWSAVRRRETPLMALFPWFSRHRLTVVLADLKRHWAMLVQRRLPDGDAETPLASAVHGLGLLTALAMGATGAWLYTQSVPAGVVLEVHKAVANLMWAYVVGHAGLAVLHQATGHPVLRRMFGRNRT